MIILYRVLTNCILILLPIILFFRILKKKEDPKRFIEKIGIKTVKIDYKNVIWFHVSSVGELISILPLIEKIEKRTNKKILLTSNTTSSAEVFKKYKFKNTFHQYFPLDNNLVIKKFLNNWEPSLAIFVESEIWPNTTLEINKRKIPLILLNGRITKKSFYNWSRFKVTSNYIFSKFDLCLCQNRETANYLKKLGSKKILQPGNLKFSEISDVKKFKLRKKLNKFFLSKNLIIGGISTHDTEEKFCIELFKNLRKKFNKFMCILIPRHVSRTNSIIENLKDSDLTFHRHSDKKFVNKKVDVYIVDTFGEAKKFIDKCSVVFVGGSLIDHGGQNPLEAARSGCKIIHGPNIDNFTEVYALLKLIGLSYEIKRKKDALNIIDKILKNKVKRKQNIKKLKIMGQRILNENYRQLSNFI